MKAPANLKFTGFCDLLADALYQNKLASQSEDSYIMNRHSRASIIASALSVECTANCLIRSLDISSKLMGDLDKLPALSKIESYLLTSSYKAIDRGKNEIEKIQEIVRLRNEFVHPKSWDIKSEIGPMEDHAEYVAVPVSFDADKWSALRIPKRSMFWRGFNSQVHNTIYHNIYR